MDVTFVSSGEKPFKMEVGFFDTAKEIKQKLQSYKGWSAATLSLFYNGDVLEDVDGDDDGGVAARYGIVDGSSIDVARDGVALRVVVVAGKGGGRLEVAVGARGAVSALRGQLERAARASGFPLPRGGAYFFIHGQSVMHEERSFEWHGVVTGDEIAVFHGSVTRGLN